MMSKSRQAAGFVDELAGLHFDDAFNPYSDACPDHDSADAVAIRRSNLALVVEAALGSDVDSIWIARDLGYRGGRRTGLALTDELHLAMHAELFQTGPLTRATKGPPIGERTASMVWQILRAIERPIFLWNVFPLHPHAHGDPMSNRCHTRAERAACRPLLTWLLETLKPKTVVAIGQDARAALEELNISAVTVRHPSYGGQAAFAAGMFQLYGRPPEKRTSEQQRLIS
jgi:hypothetical protein